MANRRHVRFTDEFVNNLSSDEVKFVLPHSLETLNYGTSTDESDAKTGNRRSPYGLKQSGSRWYYKLDEKIKSLEFKLLNSDKCVYYSKSSETIMLDCSNEDQRSWSSCFSNVRCGKGHRVRKVACHDSLNLLVADSNCDQSTKPTTVERCFRVCDKHKNILRKKFRAISTCNYSTVAHRCMVFVHPLTISQTAILHRTVCARDGPQECQLHFGDHPEASGRFRLRALLGQTGVGDGLFLGLPHALRRHQTKRYLQFAPLSTSIALTKEVVDLYVAPTEGGTPCPEELNSPVCPVLSPQEGCRGGIRTNRKNIS
ncbi:hypothetical protein CEXT_726661 [Caerostris extrusa]|uniref:Uncharacterized protein n=1 Tax=Caerostris extrusa TaxID=172846 RepID=A0AAV4U3N2_CAEEX|nr:hypothetical protein CEXT_726661 [Caerostris extrusa]